MWVVVGGGGGGMQAKTETGRSSARAGASTTMSMLDCDLSCQKSDLSIVLDIRL